MSKHQIGHRVAVLATLLLTLAATATFAAAEGVVNINTAGADELMLLPMVGPSVAQRIIDFREQNGRFGEATDLLLVKGIGDKTFERIEPYVALTGDTSLKEKAKVKRGEGSSGHK